jgi:hydroxymethylpyrimidine pyrophosphatase-like HAD family hydrolase
LSKLLTLLGLDTDDAVVFGDSVNDISMFEVCKTKVAVGNAVDELKAIATDVTKSYKEDGVAYWLNKNINNKI